MGILKKIVVVCGILVSFLGIVAIVDLVVFNTLVEYKTEDNVVAIEGVVKLRGHTIPLILRKIAPEWFKGNFIVPAIEEQIKGLSFEEVK